MNIRHDNSFDAIRFIASSIVIYSHSFPLVLNTKSEPFAILTQGYTDGGKFAVATFFILSGFLIAGSWTSNNNLYYFLINRSKRIFPALIIVLLISLFLGAAITTVGNAEYINSSLLYFVKNVTLFKGQAGLNGVFETNPYGAVVNGSLWTLRHEFTCYILIAALGCTRLLRNFPVWVLWLTITGSSLLNLSSINFFQEFLPLCVWFLAGTLAYLHRDLELNRARLGIAIILLTATITLGLSSLIVSPVIAFLLIRISYLPSIFSNFGKYGDFSYGIYIYAFPVQQFVIYLITKSVLGPMEWWVVFLVSFPITLSFAVASWHLVEKRFLRRKAVGS